MKFLACDLDGTLLHTESNSVLKENRLAIKKLKEKGYKFIISTGRDLKGTEKSVLKYDDIDYDYLILCNGALILDKNLNKVFHNTLSHELVKEIYDEYYNLDDMAMYVTYDDESSVFHSGEKTQFKDFLGTFEKINNEDEVFALERDYSLISLFSKSNDYETAENIKNSIFDKYNHSLSVFRNQAFVDIVGKDCSKGSALLKVMEIEGWDVDNLYAIGDSFNDVSMFNITKNSYTFNHAEDKIKEIANHTVDYVYECINQILEA